MMHRRVILQFCMDAWVMETDAGKHDLQMEALSIRIKHLESELGIEREKRYTDMEALREKQLRVGRRVAGRLFSICQAELVSTAFMCWARNNFDDSSSDIPAVITDTMRVEHAIIPPLPLKEVSLFDARLSPSLSAHCTGPLMSQRSSSPDSAAHSVCTSNASSRSLYSNVSALSAAARKTFLTLQQALRSPRSGRHTPDPYREDLPSARHNPHMYVYDMTHDSDTMMLDHAEEQSVMSHVSTAMATASARRAAAKGAAAAASVRAARASVHSESASPARRLVLTGPTCSREDARPRSSDRIGLMSLFEAGLSPRRPRSQEAQGQGAQAPAWHQRPVDDAASTQPCATTRQASEFKAFEGTLI